MSADPKETGELVERLLGELETAAEPEVAQRAEELVRALMELYGAGLSRVIELAQESPDSNLLAMLTADELVAGLLVLHGLHPQDVTERVQQALDQVRPYLGSHAGGVELVGVDSDAVVHLRLQGSCDGCPSSAVTVKLAIERAIEQAAPEVTGLEVEGLNEPGESNGSGVIPAESLLRGPPEARSSADSNVRAGDGDWTSIEGLDGLVPGRVDAVEVDGTRLVVCRVDGQLYAYRDACPGCGSTLVEGQLNETVLACPACSACFDVRLAGRSTTDAELHLDPLPLLTEGDTVRVAIPAGALA